MMKAMSIVAILLMGIASASFAASDGASGDINGQAAVRQYMPPLDTSTLADPDDPTSGVTVMSPLEDILPPVRETETYAGLWGYQNLFGQDRLIYPGDVGSSQDYDYDPSTGYLYAAFDTYHTTGDSLIVYRSTNDGLTWARWGVCTNTDGGIQNAKVRIVTAGGYTWVCVLGIWVETSGTNNLWMRRWRVDGTNPSYELVDDDALFADMDADVGSSGYLYVTYVPDASENDVCAARNALAGAGWVNDTILYGNPGITPYPAIAAGMGGNVSVVFCEDLTTNREVRIKRSTNYGASWLTSEQVSNNSADNPLSFPDVAFDRDTPQSGWIAVTFETSTSDNIGWYTSDNSGVTWTYGAIFPSSGDESFCSLRSSKGTGSVTVAYMQDPGDKAIFTWASASNPTSFSTPVQINDSGITGLWGPTAGWKGGNSTVIFTWMSGYALYFESFDNGGTGIEGEPAGFSGIHSSPNPFMDTATIGFTLTGASPVSIEVYDVLGRTVSTLVDGSTLPAGDHEVQWNGCDLSGAQVPAGVYYCRLSTTDASESLSMVVVR